jgi:hypothetical protein
LSSTRATLRCRALSGDVAVDVIAAGVVAAVETDSTATVFAESVRAVFFLPTVAVAVPPLVTLAVFLVPPVANAVPRLVAVAVHRMQLVAPALLPSPRATARECSPGVVIATVVSLGSVSRTTTPVTDLVTGTLPTAVTFGFFADGAAEVVDEASVDEDVSGFDGLAEATNGIANIPAPIPSATANAPTRPT